MPHYSFNASIWFQALERKGRGKSIHAARIRCRWGAFLLFKGSWPIFRAHQLLLRGRNRLCPRIPARQTHSLQGFEAREPSVGQPGTPEDYRFRIFEETDGQVNGYLKQSS